MIKGKAIWLCVGWFGMCASLGLLGCSSAADSERTTSETHFMRECTDTCEQGLDCICGVCTRPCQSNSSCSDLGMDVVCVTAAGSVCPGDAQVLESVCYLGTRATTDTGGGSDASIDTAQDTTEDTVDTAQDTTDDAVDTADTAPSPECGDGSVDVGVGEECDDGNSADGDGCSSDCTSEDVFVESFACNSDGVGLVAGQILECDLSGTSTSDVSVACETIEGEPVSCECDSVDPLNVCAFSEGGTFTASLFVVDDVTTPLSGTTFERVLVITPTVGTPARRLLRVDVAEDNLVAEPPYFVGFGCDPMDTGDGASGCGFDPRLRGACRGPRPRVGLVYCRANVGHCGLVLPNGRQRIDARGDRPSDRG